MHDINVDETLWSSGLLPVGILERWFCADGSTVMAGDPIAMIRIEDALHEIAAPMAGRLRIITAAPCVVDPGALIGAISDVAAARAVRDS